MSMKRDSTLHRTPVVVSHLQIYFHIQDTLGEKWSLAGFGGVISNQAAFSRVALFARILVKVSPINVISKKKIWPITALGVSVQFNSVTIFILEQNNLARRIKDHPKQFINIDSIKVACWNVRTLLDGKVSNRPQMKIALTAHALSRYDIDMSDQLQEIFLGYTFFCKGKRTCEKEGNLVIKSSIVEEKLHGFPLENLSISCILAFFYKINVLFSLVYFLTAYQILVGYLMQKWETIVDLLFVIITIFLMFNCSFWIIIFYLSIIICLHESSIPIEYR